MPKPEQNDLFSSAPLPVAPLGDAQRLACLRLIRSENVGPATFRALINHYGGASDALDALPDLSRRGGRSRAIQICPVDTAEAELEAARKIGAEPLFTIEPGYPQPLAFVDGGPPMLYIKGRKELLSQTTSLLSGSRQSSAGGVKFSRQMAGGLSAAGIVVASGLARGVDGAAHQAALAGGTIAVVAGGLDIKYPPEHAALQDEIGDRGCLVSEMPPHFKPRGKDFPRRNRIISGISRAVVVVEAARRSGSLITARMANEQGREVFAVPGHPLDPRAEGTNKLLKEGATIATSAEDVIEALFGFDPQRHAGLDRLGESAVQERIPPALSIDHTSPAVDEARQVVSHALGPAPIEIDELARATGLNIRSVQIIVMELALAGKIEWHGRQLISIKADG